MVPERRPIRERLWRALGCGALVSLALLACGSGPPPQPPPDEAERLVAMEQRLAALEAQVRALETDRARLLAQLDEAEQRLGARPFAPRLLRPVDGGLRFGAGKAMVVEAHGARARAGDLARHGAGHPAYVVAYWATWCKPCTTPEELAALGELERELSQAGRALVGVAVDDLPTITGHARAAEWHYPIWQHKDAHLAWLPKAFVDKAGLSLPLFLVVSADGGIRYYHAAKLDPAARRELVTAAIVAGRRT